MRYFTLALSILAVGCGSENSSTDLPDGSATDAAAMTDGGDTDLGAITDGGQDPDLAGADLGPRTVQGKLLDRNDNPVTGFTVSIGAAQTTTDGTGSFSLLAPGGSYDVLVTGVEVAGQAQPGQTHVLQHRGLTRSDPSLRLFAAVTVPAAPYQATASGGFTGLAAPLDATGFGQLRADVNALDGKTFDNTSATLDFTNVPIHWAGTATQSTVLRALFTTNPGTGSYSVTGYGQAAVTLNNGVTSTLASPIALTVPSTQNLSATVTGAPGANGSGYRTFLLVGSINGTTGAAAVPAGGVLSLPQPVIAGSTIQFRAFSNYSASPLRSSNVVYSGLAPNAAVGAVVIAAPGTTTTPPGAPNAVPRAADFAIQGGGGIGALHTFRFTSATGDWMVVDAAASVRFPDGSALGVSNPAAGVTLNGVITEYNYTSVDAVSGTRNYLNPLTGVDAGKDYRYATSDFSPFAFTN